MDRVVSALGPADGPRAPGLARLGGQRVVAALAVGAADRMDRRQVGDVEPHRGRPLELALGVAKRPVAAGDVGAGEELVPGGEARALAVDDDLVFALGPGGVGAVEVRVHEAAERGVVRGRRGGDLVAAGEGLGPAGQPPGVVAGRAPGGGLDQRRALAQLAGHVLARRHPLVEVGQPGAERVGQRLDGVEVARVVLEDERARPAIVVDEPHRRLAPGRLVDAAVLQERDERLVAFLEDVGADLERVADLALDRVAPGIHGRCDVLDDDRAAQLLGIERGARAGVGSARLAATTGRPRRPRDAPGGAAGGDHDYRQCSTR